MARHLPRILARLRDIAIGWHTPTIESIYFLLTATLGIWFITHPDTFSISGALAIPASIAPARAWGGVMLMIASIRFVGLVDDSYPCRIVAACGGMMIWSSMATGVRIRQPDSMGVPLFAILSFVCGYSLYRLIVEYRTVRELRRAPAGAGGAARSR